MLPHSPESVVTAVVRFFGATVLSGAGVPTPVVVAVVLAGSTVGFVVSRWPTFGRP
jgi:ABC-type xylose transport system permease subunit